MACCDDQRSGHAKRLHAYLGAPATPANLRDPWSVLAACGPQEPCKLTGPYGQGKQPQNSGIA
jgi:hypothetical protein